MMHARLLKSVIDQINVGVLVIDGNARVLLCNRFMEIHSGHSAENLLGHDLFACFPELPRRWFETKIRSVMLTRQSAFSAWEQRPRLFHFANRRPLTGGVDWMYQNCDFLPLVDEATDAVEGVCVIIHDVTDIAVYQRELQATKAHLAKLSVSDPLTGVANRRHLEDVLAIELKRSRRHDLALSVLMFDIDHFKRVNDTHGHLAGDEVICHVARIAAQSLRESDTLGRYGGEEFTLILPETGLAGAQAVAERLCRTIAETPAMVEGTPIHTTVSIGVAEREPDETNHDGLLDRADAGLYRAKLNGRNQVAVAE